MVICASPFTSTTILISLPGLIDILSNVLTLQLPHPLDLIKVHNKALIVRVVQLYALTAEYRLVVRAVKMLHTLWVLKAKLISHRVLILLFKIKVAFCELFVLLDYFV